MRLPSSLCLSPGPSVGTRHLTGSSEAGGQARGPERGAKLAILAGQCGAGGKDAVGNAGGFRRARDGEEEGR